MMKRTLLVLGSMTDFNWAGYANLIEPLRATPVMAMQRVTKTVRLGTQRTAFHHCAESSFLSGGELTAALWSLILSHLLGELSRSDPSRRSYSYHLGLE